MIKKLIIVDTSAWILLFQKRNHGDLHKKAKLFYETCKEEFCVTDLIIEETHKWLVHHGHPPQQSLEILQSFISQQFAKIISLEEADRYEAIKHVDKYLDHNLSYTDAITVALMRRIGIKKIFSFDRHFSLFKGIEKMP